MPDMLREIAKWADGRATVKPTTLHPLSSLMEQTSELQLLTEFCRSQGLSWIKSESSYKGYVMYRKLERKCDDIICVVNSSLIISLQADIKLRMNFSMLLILQCS